MSSSKLLSCFVKEISACAQINPEWENGVQKARLCIILHQSWTVYAQFQDVSLTVNDEVFLSGGLFMQWLLCKTIWEFSIRCAWFETFEAMLLVKSDFGDEAANKLLRQDSKTCHVRFPEISSNAMSHASLPFPGWFILYRRFNKTSVPKAFSIFLKQNSKILQSYLNIFKRQNNSWYSWIDESLLILTRWLSMKFTVSGQESVRSLRESLGGLGESRHFLAPTGTVALLYSVPCAICA